MTFKEKKTGKIVKAKNSAEFFAFSHNSDYEQIFESKEEKIKSKSK